jgi:phenylacetate-coenzyme A ligase PaaK-like adenylate-forming protein
MRRKLFDFYNRVPSKLKNVFSKIARFIPNRFIFGLEFKNVLRMIELTEYLPQKNLIDKQNENLCQILLHSYRTTNYYKEKINEKGISEQDILNSPSWVLSEIDFVDKSTIRDNYPQFISSAKEELLCDYTSTGGTSGEPFYFHINSDRSQKEWAYFVNQWGRVGFSFNSKRVSFRGSRIRGKNGWEDDWVTRERKFSSHYVNTWNIVIKLSPKA